MVKFQMSRKTRHGSFPESETLCNSLLAFVTQGTRTLDQTALHGIYAIVRPGHATPVAVRKPRAFDCERQELEPSVTVVRHPQGLDRAPPTNGSLHQNLAGRRWRRSADDVARAIKRRATAPTAALISSTTFSPRHCRRSLSLMCQYAYEALSHPLPSVLV